MDAAAEIQPFLIDGVGLWVERRSAVNFENRPAVFLDRDGVLVEEVHFLARPEDVQLTFGMGKAIAELNRLSIAVVVVTNQSGVARGRLTWEAFARVQAEINHQLASIAATVDATFACGYHCEGEGPLAIADHPWRKPASGMLQEAHRLLGVDLRRSLIIGDRLTDLEAGHGAGLLDGAIVRTGYGERDRKRLPEARERWRQGGFSARVADNAAQAIQTWLAELATR
ncbi:HAD-IIIA family hydrolase [Methylocapsa sp. S129]|uniref:D-glycero-alpha-D-manno-heptose-1,7-bisphosphate 7-phosphatase n=1 Tax=Methylocapsa sp. S129 TaxID=1641869 RepID=UPI00131D605E|nr:HAD-IIIA family hydrolase [Methylocapsa sp. S129]